jgi:hypothetical protein
VGLPQAGLKGSIMIKKFLRRLLEPLFARVIYDEMADIRRVSQKFGMIVNSVPTHLTKRKLGEQVELLREELKEFEDACLIQDLDLQADALVDLVVIAKRTAAMLGLPWEALWDDVQRANMAKERGVGKRGHAIDLIKPRGWVGPQTTQILDEAGYRRYHFTLYSHGGAIDENLCCDDAHITMTRPA